MTLLVTATIANGYKFDVGSQDSQTSPQTSPTPEQRQQYIEFATVFDMNIERGLNDPLEYAWEPHEVTTEDG